MAETAHNKQFEIVIAVLGMIGGGILPFPELIGWAFVVFVIVNFLSMIFLVGRKMYWLAALAFYFLVVDSIGIWIHLLLKFFI